MKQENWKRIRAKKGVQSPNFIFLGFKFRNDSERTWIYCLKSSQYKELKVDGKTIQMISSDLYEKHKLYMYRGCSDGRKILKFVNAENGRCERRYSPANGFEWRNIDRRRYGDLIEIDGKIYHGYKDVIFN